MKLKKVIIIVSIVCVVIVIAVSAFLRHQKLLALQIEDLNGPDDKSLCTITDEMIEEGYTSKYQAYKRHVRSKGLNSSGVEGHYEDRDNSYTYTRIGKLSGIYVANAVLGTGREVTYTIDSKITSGNFRLIITDENNTILQDLPFDQKITTSISTEAGKLYYLKFIAETAELEIELWRDMH